MTNARQVRPIYRAILERYPNFKEMNSRFLLKTPVHHLSTGIFIERSSDPDCCWPRMVVAGLFFSRIYNEIRIGTYFEGLVRPSKSEERSWLWSDPTMVADAIEVIETVALPKMIFYGTPGGYATLPPREHQIFYEPPAERMLVHIAAGDLDVARKIWHEQEPLCRGKSYNPASRPYQWRRQLEAVAEPLFADDRPALARILHTWEAANVRGTELEPYWEPTPFPLEL